VKKEPFVSKDNSSAPTPTVAVPVPAGMTQEQMMAMFGAFMAQMTAGITTGMQEARGPRKVAMGQYDPKTPFHPNKKKASRLTRPVFQNNTRLAESQLFDREIDLLNQIVRSGRYINRLIEVVVTADGAEEIVYISYKNKTIDDRMEHKGAYRDLSDMLRQIVAEQNEMLAQEGVVREERKARRESFSSAATREARARAAADEAPDEP